MKSLLCITETFSHDGSEITRLANRKQARTLNDLIFLFVGNSLMKSTATDNFLHSFAIFIDDIARERFTFRANLFVFVFYWEQMSFEVYFGSYCLLRE